MTVTQTLQQAVDDAMTTLVSFVDTKKASTAALSRLVDLTNSRAAYSMIALALGTYVAKFNELTALSNTLRTQMANVKALSDTMVVSLANLTDEQVEEMKANPQQYFCAGYLALCNSLLFYGREQGLAIADMVRTDLVTDINNAWNDHEAGITPDVPRTAVVYESGHALELVDKALKDVTLP